MAVYERTFRRYDGPLTDLRWRAAVITRYALEGVFASRLFTAFYAGCGLPTLVGVLLVYLAHNAALLEQLGASPDFLRALTAAFFEKLFIWQAVPAFFISVMVGPGLVAPDLSNSALPLYLSRPITRRDYVLGKLAVLVGLLSPVTWGGGLLVWLLQATLEGGSWWSDNLRIAVAYLVGHGVWIMVVSLLTLAVSAWVRLKPVAVATLVGLYLFLGAVAQSVNGMTGTKVGSVFNLVESVYVVVASIFSPDAPTDFPLWLACLSLATVAALSLLALRFKLKAHEVVR
jgi:ABC-type transport system involved in multi-copper enzyme maturation permease subunit